MVVARGARAATIGLLHLLVVVLQAVILVRYIVEEVLDVVIVQDLFQEEVLPDFVELQLTMLVLVIDGLVKEEPELFQVLQAVLQLLVRPHYHVERLLVLLLAVNEVLEAGARVLDVAPRRPLALLADELVSLPIVDVHFLLLLEGEVQLGVEASRGVS